MTLLLYNTHATAGTEGLYHKIESPTQNKMTVDRTAEVFFFWAQ